MVSVMREMRCFPDGALAVHACDLSGEAIERARVARYNAWSFRGTPPWVLEGYFEPVDEGAYRLRPEVADKVTFERAGSC